MRPRDKWGLLFEWYTGSMSRFIWFIVVILGLLILLGGYWALRDTSPAPLSHTPEGDIVTIASLLQERPTTPNFVERAEGVLLAEGKAEVESVGKHLMEPLEELQSIAKDTVNLLESGRKEWCEPIRRSVLLSTDPDLIPSEELYRDSLDEERTVRDAERISREASTEEAWSLWLVQLGEKVAQGENKSQEKAVEKFQEAFGEVTDSYEETMTQALLELREKTDARIFAKGERAQTALNLYRSLEQSLSTELTLCDQGKDLSIEGRNRARQQVTVWNGKVGRDLQEIKTLQNTLANFSEGASSTILPKVKQFTADFQAAVIKLEQTLD